METNLYIVNHQRWLSVGHTCTHTTYTSSFKLPELKFRGKNLPVFGWRWLYTIVKVEWAFPLFPLLLSPVLSQLVHTCYIIIYLLICVSVPLICLDSWRACLIELQLLNASYTAWHIIGAQKLPAEWMLLALNNMLPLITQTKYNKDNRSPYKFSCSQNQSRIWIPTRA